MEAVIGLAPNLFYGATLSPCILIFRNKKLYKDKILFIDASEQVKIGRAQNYLEEDHVDQIFEWYKNHSDVQDFVCLVDNKVIAANDYNLNIPLYI